MKIINLLPDSEKEALQKQKFLSGFRKFMFFSFLSFILVTLALIGGRIYEEEALSNLDWQIEQQRKAISTEKDTALRKQIDKYNGYLTDYNQLSSLIPSWSPVLEEFANLVPSGIIITSFNGNAKSGKIDIAGKADTRDQILDLHDRIANSKTFKSIDMPLENLQKPTKLDFHFTIYLADNVLVKKNDVK